MKLTDVVQYARGGTFIRRRSWIEGLRMFWSDSLGGWRFANQFEVFSGQSRTLTLESQGMLTPESIRAEDWEVIR